MPSLMSLCRNAKSSDLSEHISAERSNTQPLNERDAAFSQLIQQAYQIADPTGSRFKDAEKHYTVNSDREASLASGGIHANRKRQQVRVRRGRPSKKGEPERVCKEAEKEFDVRNTLLLERDFAELLGSESNQVDGTGNMVPHTIDPLTVDSPWRIFSKRCPSLSAAMLDEFPFWKPTSETTAYEIYHQFHFFLEFHPIYEPNRSYYEWYQIVKHEVRDAFRRFNIEDAVNTARNNAKNAAARIRKSR